MFHLTLHISHRTLNIKWCTCVWDNVGTWHLQEVDPLNSGEEENENKDWHFFFHHVTFSLDSVPSFHFYIFGSFLVTDEVIFKQQGVEPELGLTFLQPLLVHRRCFLSFNQHSWMFPFQGCTKPHLLLFCQNYLMTFKKKVFRTLLSHINPFRE